MKWGIKNIALFHHDPSYTDKRIFSFKKSADWYKNKDESGRDELSVFIAQEGMEIEI